MPHWFYHSLIPYFLDQMGLGGKPRKLIHVAQLTDRQIMSSVCGRKTLDIYKNLHLRLQSEKGTTSLYSFPFTQSPTRFQPRDTP